MKPFNHYTPKIWSVLYIILLIIILILTNTIYIVNNCQLIINSVSNVTFSLSVILFCMFWTSRSNCILSSLFLPLFFFSHTGRLLDATKNYKYIFLLAGSEVFLAALVLGISNFLFMRKKSPPTPLEDLAAKMEMCGEALEMTTEDGEEEDDQGAKDVVKEEVKGGERMEEGEEVEAVDSQAEEEFLKKPQLNGEASSNCKTRL